MDSLLNKAYVTGVIFKGVEPIFEMLLVSLSDNISTEEVLIFQKRYCEHLQVKQLQSCGLSNFQNNPIVQDQGLRLVRPWPCGRIFFRSPILTACRFAVFSPTETHKTFLKISKPPLFKRIVTLLRQVLPFQSDPISKVHVIGVCIFFAMAASTLIYRN